MQTLLFKIIGVLFFVIGILGIGHGVWLELEMLDWWCFTPVTTGFQGLDWALTPIIVFVFPSAVVVIPFVIGALCMNLSKEDL